MDGKKYFRLTPDDLREHPIWVLAMDVHTFGEAEDDDWDDDTGIVVPLPDDPELAARLFEHCIYYSRAEFAAPGGRTYLGMLKCSAGDGVQSTSPTIVTDAGHVDFYLTIHEPTPEELAREYARLGTTPDELFPLAYGQDAPAPHAEPGGVLDGFYFLDLRGGGEELRCVR